MPRRLLTLRARARLQVLRDFWYVARVMGEADMAGQRVVAFPHWAEAASDPRKFQKVLDQQRQQLRGADSSSGAAARGRPRSRQNSANKRKLALHVSDDDEDSDSEASQQKKTTSVK